MKSKMKKKKNGKGEFTAAEARSHSSTTRDPANTLTVAAAWDEMSVFTEAELGAVWGVPVAYDFRFRRYAELNVWRQTRGNSSALKAPGDYAS